ncbi:hypothetical protein KP509_09G004300 [Ceratopteris richardii]|uniref:Uncharacterized protein n=1 Tax=Ceratopteris richardii TaxID=49495 RepID=A0A8T2U420_CERRI|nr:hypothetical protein KP509_09G004300 [Ceratopteris richardii]
MGSQQNVRRGKSPEKMSLQELFEEGPPCAARAADGALRMVVCGITWGILAGSHDSLREGYRGLSRIPYVAKSCGRYSLLWGGCAGTYFGLNCGLERLRKKRDWANATVAGALTGAILAVISGNGSRILASSAVLSAAATALDFISPLQYPPTGLWVEEFQ